MDTAITVRSGCACFPGLSTAVVSEIAVPVHVEDHCARQSFVSPEQGVPREQQLEQVVHDIVEGLVVLALRNNRELELLYSRHVQLKHPLVDRVGQEVSNLLSLLQVPLS